VLGGTIRNDLTIIFVVFHLNHGDSCPKKMKGKEKFDQGKPMIKNVGLINSPFPFPTTLAVD